MATKEEVIAEISKLAKNLENSATDKYPEIKAKYKCFLLLIELTKENSLESMVNIVKESMKTSMENSKNPRLSEIERSCWGFITLAYRDYLRAVAKEHKPRKTPVKRSTTSKVTIPSSSEGMIINKSSLTESEMNKIDDLYFKYESKFPYLKTGGKYEDLFDNLYENSADFKKLVTQYSNHLGDILTSAPQVYGFLKALIELDILQHVSKPLKASKVSTRKTAIRKNATHRIVRKTAKKTIRKTVGKTVKKNTRRTTTRKIRR